jgi:hypothetical protein
MLTAEYLTDLEHRARRFSGAYFGTGGTLAAGIIHLINERASMTATIDRLTAENQALRDAVECRLAGGVVAAEAACCEGGGCHPAEDADEPAGKIPSDWILQGERELKRDDIRQLGDGVMHADAPKALSGDASNESEALLLDSLAAVRDRRKSYGPPREHFAITAGLVNAAFGTNFSAADWAVVMILDKVARSRGPLARRDNWTDVAGYAACRAECEAP